MALSYDSLPVILALQNGHILLLFILIYNSYSAKLQFFLYNTKKTLTVVDTEYATVAYLTRERSRCISLNHITIT